MNPARHDTTPFTGFAVAPSRMRAAVLAPGAYTGTRTAMRNADAHALASRNAP